MSLSYRDGRLFCTVTNSPFGPAFDSEGEADDFLEFIQYYPQGWRNMRSFSSNSQRDPRGMKADELDKVHRAWLEVKNTEPSRRLWRTLVVLRSVAGQVLGNIPGWEPRLWVELDGVLPGGVTDVGLRAVEYLNDDHSRAVAAIPGAVADKVRARQGALIRCHCWLNIGAAGWHDLRWPTNEGDWEFSENEGKGETDG